MIYWPILGALALAGGTILERAVLKIKKIGIGEYQTASFLAILTAMLPFIYFFWRVDGEALSGKNIAIFAAVILFSIVANLLTFYSMKWEKVSNLEPAKILEPLFVVILAIVFSFFISNIYNGERNLSVTIPAVLAACALVFSHIKKHHLDFNKYFLAAIGGSFFFALELVISRLILDFYSPLSFYFLRCASIFLISFAAFRPRFKSIDMKTKKWIFLTGAIWVVYRVVIYYGYVTSGIVFTTLMVMLGPVFIYFFAWKFLKEKLNWKNIVAACVIIASVLYVLLA